MKDDDNGCLVTLLGVVALVCIGVAVRGFVVAKFWAWYMVPLFDMRPLTMLQAYGLMLTLAVFTGDAWKSDGKEKEDFCLELVVKYCFNQVIIAGLVLLVGWIVAASM